MLPKIPYTQPRLGAVAATPKAAMDIEDQAIGRADRQGQRKHITVVR